LLAICRFVVTRTDLHFAHAMAICALAGKALNSLADSTFLSASQGLLLALES
jgi:hypothetical protein